MAKKKNKKKKGIIAALIGIFTTIIGFVTGAIQFIFSFLFSNPIIFILIILLIIIWLIRKIFPGAGNGDSEDGPLGTLKKIISFIKRFPWGLIVLAAIFIFIAWLFLGPIGLLVVAIICAAIIAREVYRFTKDATGSSSDSDTETETEAGAGGGASDETTETTTEETTTEEETDGYVDPERDIDTRLGEDPDDYTDDGGGSVAGDPETTPVYPWWEFWKWPIWKPRDDGELT